MSATLKLALHDVAEPEALARIAERRVADLSAALPSLITCRLAAEPAGAQFEAHVELFFPERQVIFNRLGATAEAALIAALDAVAKARSLPLAA